MEHYVNSVVHYDTECEEVFPKKVTTTVYVTKDKL